MLISVLDLQLASKIIEHEALEIRPLSKEKSSVVTPFAGTNEDVSDISDGIENLEDLLKKSAKDPLCQPRNPVQIP